MSLSSRIRSAALAADAKVADLHERTPNHTNDKGEVVEFFATEQQVAAIVAEAVSNIGDLSADLAAEVRANMKEGAK